MKAKYLNIEVLLPVKVNVELIDGHYYCNFSCPQWMLGGKCYSGNLALDKSELIEGHYLCRAECHVAAHEKELKDE